MRKVVLALLEVAASQHGAFSRHQARELGVTRSLIRWHVTSGLWIQKATDVFVIAGTPDTWLQRLWCAHLEAGPTSAISHQAAAQLLRLPGYTRQAVDVSRREVLHHSLKLGRLHNTSWLPSAHLTTIEGLPVTRIARCVFDLAGDPPSAYSRNPEIRARQLETHIKRVTRIFNNSLLYCGNTIEEQLHVVATLGRRGRPDTTVMRAITADLAPDHTPTESELEDLFLDTCHAYGIELPECQINLGVERPEGRVDFYYRRARLVVEVDSRWHDTPDNQVDDAWRDLRFAALGIQIVRIRWRNLVQDPERVMRELAAALDVRADCLL